MATEFPQSPLLQARLEFLGGVGRGNFNIFFEVSNLSGLSLLTMENKDQSQKKSSETSNFKSTNQHIFEEEATPVGNNSQKEQSATNMESKRPYSSISGPETSPGSSFSVLDRAQEGDIRQVPYMFKTKTLQVFDTFEKLKIPFETEVYKPQQQRRTVDSNIFYCKNLFLKDRKGQFYLVLCHEDYNMDLKQLRQKLNACRNFNFGTADDMQTILGTEPGGVTPLALVNPKAADVKMVIHKSLLNEDAWLMFHPIDAKLATKITLPSLLRYLKSCNHLVTFVK